MYDNWQFSNMASGCLAANLLKFNMELYKWEKPKKIAWHVVCVHAVIYSVFICNHIFG